MDKKSSYPAPPSSKISVRIDLESDLLIPICGTASLLLIAWSTQGLSPHLQPIIKLIKLLLVN